MAKFIGHVEVRGTDSRFIFDVDDLALGDCDTDEEREELISQEFDRGAQNFLEMWWEEDK